MVELRGIQGPSNKIAIDKELRGQLRKGKRAFLLQLHSLNLGAATKTTDGIPNSDFWAIMNQYAAIFQEAQCWPPQRS